MGTKLGRYEVVKHLARGGMADLCVARATGIEGFERHVVIKHLRPEQSGDAAFVQMFVTEARLAAALHHHNIVQVHDIGNEAGRHFFAMEYVHGEDVRRVLARLASLHEVTPLAHVVTIATTVAAALHHAHEQKDTNRKALDIVHRDVTPANIIVGYDGNVKVVDFGIAKAAMRTSDTGVGMLKGKVPYMSPEQCTGKPVDRRSDVFSLGIVLYELVTVRRLFKGGNEFFTMSAVVHGDIPKPSSHRADLPVALEAIILKALSRKPSDRYQTADEMRVALDKFADQAGLRTSNTVLADYMKTLFGERPEPWMADDVPAVEQAVDFDKTDVGLAAIPSEAIEMTTIPKSVTTTRDSLIEHARLNAMREPTPRPPSKPIPSLVNGTRAKPPPTPVVAVSPPELEDVAGLIEDDHARASTDVDERTDVSTPPPPPRLSKVIVAADREPTEIVSPLPIEELGELTGMTRQPSDRRWLLVGGVAAAALIVAVVIMLTGRNVEVDQVARTNVATQPTDDPPPIVAPTGATTTYRPLEPAKAHVSPKVDTAESPKTDEPKAEPAKAEAAKTEPVKTEPVKTEPPKTEPPKTEAKPTKTPVKPRPAVKPTAKPPAKPPVKPTTTPKWDPDALFLNKSK